jgi:hypothetical protein
MLCGSSILELVIVLLLQPFECYDYRFGPPHPASTHIIFVFMCAVLEIKPRALCILGKHSTTMLHLYSLFFSFGSIWVCSGLRALGF